ncbi:MAG: DNA gyrase inhibitor YacG [Thiobacillus sp.]|nr:DNA gyrase inhibitor YacG [Thiobacillus sp.]
MKPAAKLPVVSCPICGAAVKWTAENRWKPICSERCKMIDLGQWAAEKYRVPADEQEPEDDLSQAR